MNTPMNSMRVTILAVSLALQGYANTPQGASRIEDRQSRPSGIQTDDRGGQSTSGRTSPQQPLLNTPDNTSPQTEPQPISPVCHGSCAVYSPWQWFLSALNLA